MQLFLNAQVIRRRAIRYRWIAAAAAVLLAALWFVTGWYYMGVAFDETAIDYRVIVGSGRVSIGIVSTITNMDGWSWYPPEAMYHPPEWEWWFHGWWRTAPEPFGVQVNIPIWVMAVVAAVGSASGFVANAHLRRSAGTRCHRCGYVLAGLSVCPECGTARQ